MRLRQIVMVAADLDAAELAIERDLGLERCFRDPGVAAFGLRNALFPIGDKLLEVVAPTRAGTTAGRQIDKRGGDSGYMVILEVDDLDSLRDRFDEHGARIVFEATADGIVGLHLHPADVGGAILSVDRADTWGEWPWAGPVWRDHVRSGTVSDVLAVVIEADDPRAMAQRWGRLLGRDVTGDILRLDEGEIRFVPAGERGEGVSGFVLRATDADHVGTTTICNCRFELVDAVGSPARAVSGP
ncbi:MAG: VOC family protein [Ilumatobacteraceae bacterium]